MSPRENGRADAFDHRGGLGVALERLAPDPGLFERIGGRPVVGALIDALYDRLEADPALEPKFTNDLRLEREKQKRFFEEWLGGEPGYSLDFGGRGLREIHGHIHISAQDAARWLGHFEQAMRSAKVPAAQRREIFGVLKPLAHALVNESRDLDPEPRYAHRCQRAKPGPLAVKAAAKGDVDAALEILDTEARRREWGPEALFAAAQRGLVEAVERLLDAGVPLDAAAPNELVDTHQTPLFAARAKRKTKVALLLRERGAVDDIFVEASLGNVEAVEAWLEREPSQLDALDPAQDVLRLGALHHAVLASRSDVALRLLERGARVGPLGPWLLRTAIEDECLPLVHALLEGGADASRVGPGRWVLHPELSALLREHGADVNVAPKPHDSWIWDACTGNHAQREDPEYVRALIAHGADIEATYGWGRSALHLASKAGFAGIVSVLLEAGADPNQRDERDAQTPLFYAFRAGKRVDPTVVASLLLEHGADPDALDRVGKTVSDRSSKAAAFLAKRAGG